MAALVSAPAAQTSGTGIVVGVVVDATTGRGVSHVAVRAQGGGVTQTRLTDDLGRYYLKQLPPGEFAITAHKAGFIDGAYGKTQPTGDGVPLKIVKDASTPTFAQIDLFRAAVISGHVVDESGDPLAAVALRAARRTFVDGYPVLENTNAAVTDDRGAFRFFHLVPGEYVVMVQATQVTLPIALLEEIGRTGAVRSEIGALFQSATSEMPQIVDADGRHASLIGQGPSPPTTEARRSAYRTVYYPGVDRLRNALPIRIASGEHRQGLFFQMLRFPASRVTGTVASADGPLGNQVLRLLHADDEDAQVGNEVAVTVSAPDGTFAFVDITPGQYTIDARGRSFVASAVPILVERPEDAKHVWGRAGLVVDEDAVTDVEVIVSAAATVAGRIEFDRATTARGTASPIASVSLFRLGGAQPPRVIEVDDAGKFRVAGLLPGEYLLRTTPRRGWFQKAVSVDGTITDAAILVESGRDLDVVITVTDRPSEVSGVVRNDRLAPVAGATVIAQPASRGPTSPVNAALARLVRTDANGAYAFFALPAGEYSITAVDERALEGWQETRRLEAIRTAGVRVSVKDGEFRPLDLHLTGRR